MCERRASADYTSEHFFFIIITARMKKHGNAGRNAPHNNENFKYSTCGKLKLKHSTGRLREITC